MALEPITRQEKIIAGQDLTPITRMEMFLKQHVGVGGGSVPKPLTYDYMPEGYPKKSAGTVTLLEEQELAFSLMMGPLYLALLTNAFEIVEGQTYTVNWDGTEYECVGFAIDENKCAFGNPYLLEAGDDTGEPFVCEYSKYEVKTGFITLDTSASHTISVKKTEEIVTPMADEFLPATAKNTTVFYL